MTGRAIANYLGVAAPKRHEVHKGKIITFFYTADPKFLSCMGQFFNKEGGTRLKLVLKLNVWL